MNKKLALVLVMVATFLPSTVWGITNPLKSYNLYDDVMGGGNSANRNNDSAMNEYYNNSMRPGQQSTQEVAVTQEGVKKFNEINQKINNLMNNSSIPQQEKLIRLKTYNNDLKTVLDTYFKQDPDYNNIKQVLDDREKIFDSLSNSKMNAEEREKAIAQQQESVSKAVENKTKGSALNASSLSSFNLSVKELDSLGSAAQIEGRNQYLRESSTKVYADSEKKPRWTEGPSFYSKPTLQSIILKYRRSDFAGCMQESEAYVRKYPKDTLGYYYLAMSYAKVSDKENAIKAYEKVIALHDNPMIVKYATNGRNCVMGGGDQNKCYQDVNVPELKYPYAEKAASMDLTPIDPQALVNKNFAELQNQLTAGSNNTSNTNKDGEAKVNLPFGNQDEKLDEFINAPYGSGMSQELSTEYKKQQLKYLKQNINDAQNAPEEYIRNFNNVRNFDNQKSEAEIDGIKLAYDSSSFDIEQLKNDPEYLRNKKEMDELNMLFGNGDKNQKDLMDLLPSLMDKNNTVSPEVLQQMMMNSVYPDINLM